jgi:ABC-type transporter Mla subunit MlaD
VGDGKAKSDEFTEILTDLQKFEGRLNDDDPSKTIIANLQDVADHAGRKTRQ